MRVCVPYTRLGQATAIYLAAKTYEPGMEVELHDVSSSAWAYPLYLSRRWSQGTEFINLEHDVVPWPGALSELAKCPEPWCFYGYQPGIDCVENGNAPFGAVKFSPALIAGTRDVWLDMAMTSLEADPDCDNPYAWRYCDMTFYAYATARGFKAHQHYPCVFNANPAALTDLFSPITGLRQELLLAMKTLERTH